MSANDYYSEQQHGPHEYLQLGDFALESGETRLKAKLAYKTQGTLNAVRDNEILFPHITMPTR